MRSTRLLFHVLQTACQFALAGAALTSAYYLTPLQSPQGYSALRTRGKGVSSVAQILDLVGSVYDAVADASHWQTFLDAYILAVGASRGSLVLLDPNATGTGVIRWAGFLAQDIHLY